MRPDLRGLLPFFHSGLALGHENDSEIGAFDHRRWEKCRSRGMFGMRAYVGADINPYPEQTPYAE